MPNNPYIITDEELLIGERADDMITLVEAYRASYRMLVYYALMDGNWAAGSILSDFSADPAMWILWLDSVDGRNHHTKELHVDPEGA